MARPSPVRRTRLVLNSLEPRETPAGVVTASLAAGVLTLTGDDHDNVIRLKQTPAGIEVTGTDTTVTSGTQPFAGVTTVRAYLKGGNDTVTLDSTGAFALPGVSTFNLGDGDNTLTLLTDAKLDLGGLSVVAGTGQDRVTIQGGAGTGSQVTGNLAVSLGAGKAPAPPADTSSRLELRHLAVRGTGGLRYTAGGGDDVVVLDDVDVDRAVTVSAGAGALSARVTDTTVAGAVTARSVGSAEFLLRDVTTGPLALQSGPGGSTDSTVHGAVSVNGNLTIAGGSHDVTVEQLAVEAPPPDGSNYGEPSVLSVTGNIAVNGRGDIWNYGSVVRARNLTMSGVQVQYTQYYDQDDGESVLDLSGNLVLRGNSVQYYQTDGSAEIDGNVQLFGWSWAGFDNNVGGPAARVTTLVRGSVTQTAAAGDANHEIDGKAMTVLGNLTVTGALSVDIDYETDDLSQVGGTLLLNGGVRDDTFSAVGNFKSGSVTLNMKNGNNSAEIGSPDETRPTRIEGNLRMSSGAGIDRVSVVNTMIAGTTNLATGAGNDELILQSGAVFEGAVAVNLGAGNDVWTAGFEVPDPFDPTQPPVVPAGAVRFNTTSVVRMGAGDDTVRLGMPGDPAGKVVVAAGATLTVDGGLNVDTFAAGPDNEGTINPIGFETP